ncbi:MAG: hypothetical protein AUK47_06225 [Deltaproteobacteria bacterium CG2_30_63_29]|nr:MAG: hypothetical protein AUK47_06225 [Deltaproteobacteria bacterium CG2_30_63_29]PIV99969.1 MAG: hypothetical protein COW42_09315 [Deltaproteobacteria bacterium CG17_big_fil_post_rev_8_21_14_2_50_63_7]PJB44897.1 MAG: hypothetical protein CO108_08060 [Deltaproteobacteria bacterium CG_4_9_14_3_um_filter_63_12]
MRPLEVKAARCDRPLKQENSIRDQDLVGQHERRKQKGVRGTKSPGGSGQSPAWRSRRRADGAQMGEAIEKLHEH